MASASQRVIDNRFEYTQNGVLATGATDFLIARNVIYRTTADAIHISHDVFQGIHSEGGRIVCNVVRESGDDMVAIIGYGCGEPILRNILIEGNDLAGSYWGRGIGIEGARDITIRGNVVARTSHQSGIGLAANQSYLTSNVRNVLVEDNDVLEVQTTTPEYNPVGDQPRTGNGGIDISGQSSNQEVSDVMVRRNKVTSAYRDGILLRGNVSDIALQDNEMAHVGASPIRIKPWENDVSTPEPREISCSGNTQDGASADPARCSAAIPVVTGASL